MVEIKAIKVSFAGFTVNKCDNCHQTIINPITFEPWSRFKAVSKFFCCEECLNQYQIQREKQNL